MAGSSNLYQRNKDGMQITTHRTFEVPTSCNNVYSHNNRCYCCPPASQNNASEKCPNAKQKHRLATPQINSLRLNYQDIELKTAQPTKVRSTDLNELTPRSKATVVPKITQKLNFGVYQKVFKNLIPINVNDSILLPKQTTSIRKKYTKVANKIPAPELCDFLDPLQPLTHQLSEPTLRLEFHNEKIVAFDCYKRLFE